MIRSAIRFKLALCALGLLTAFAPATAKKTMLWKVESSTATVYLLGSIHAAKEDTYPLPNVIEKAYDASDTLGVEVDIASAQMNPMEIMKRARYGGDTTLKQMVKPETYAAILEKFKTHSIPEAFIAKLRPWFVVITLLQLDMSKEGFSKIDGIDMHFLKKAKESEKPIVELETIDFQLSLFERFDQYADEYFGYSLKEADKSMTDLDKMLDAWEDGDDEELTKLLDEPTDDYPMLKPLMDALLLERNKTMTVSLETLLSRNGKYFIVVGAGHVIGDDGIIEALKLTGKYKIARI